VIVGKVVASSNWEGFEGCRRHCFVVSCCCKQANKQASKQAGEGENKGFEKG